MAYLGEHMKFYEKIKENIPTIILVILFLLVVVVVGVCIQLHNKLEELGNQLMYLQDTNSILNEEIFSLQTNIESALEEEASLIENYTVEVVGMDFEKGTYQVKVSVVPKEYSDSTRTSVFFGVNEFPLVLNRYSFEGTIELPFSDAYDGNMTFLFSNGDKKNTEIAKDYVGIQTRLQELLYGSIEKIPSYRNGQLAFNHSVEYSLNEYNGREYESLELVLMADEDELAVVNLLAENIVMDEESVGEENTEELEPNDESAQQEDGDGEDIDNSVNFPNTNESGADTDGANDGNDNNIGTDNINDENNVNPNNVNSDNTNDGNGNNTDAHQEETEPVLGKSGMVQFVKNIQMEEGKNVRLFLRAKNEAGFILEYDLFSAITSQTGPNGYEETEDYFISDYTIYDEKRNGLKL